jgi:hypothetical protein
VCVWGGGGGGVIFRRLVISALQSTKPGPAHHPHPQQHKQQFELAPSPGLPLSLNFCVGGVRKEGLANCILSSTILYAWNKLNVPNRSGGVEFPVLEQQGIIEKVTGPTPWSLW